jgi:hypothetical protein
VKKKTSLPKFIKRTKKNTPKINKPMRENMAQFKERRKKVGKENEQ